MPICYKIDPQINLIFLMARGHCTASELFSFDAETWNHPLRKSNMRIMINLLDCDLDVDMKGIKNAISRNRELNSTGWELEKTAIVTHSFLLETFSKTYELMANDLPVKIKVFHSVDASLGWLDLYQHQAIGHNIDEVLLQQLTGSHPDLDR